MVYIIGAGPGHPGLLTIRAVEVLSEADVVIYDTLADSSILGHASSHAELIPVRSPGNGLPLSRDEILQIMIDRALAGQTVVRLHAGDPYLFGTGAAEALALANANIPFEVVPGISAAVSAPVYAGIPITHMDRSKAVYMVDLRGRTTLDESSIDWRAAANEFCTFVAHIGKNKLDEIVEHLIMSGRSPDDPTAAVKWGTTPAQRKITARLIDLPAKARSEGFEGPAVIVVGNVVDLCEHLDFFSKRPLYGKRILVTRARHQAGEFSRLLADLGAWPIELPMIAIQPIKDAKKLKQAFEDLSRTAWIVFTSANAVSIFIGYLFDYGLDVRALCSCKVCAIGPETARKLQDFGIVADVVAGEYTAEGVAEVLRPYDLVGKKVLVPRSGLARDVLPVMLRERGADVQILPVYETVAPQGLGESLGRLLEAGTLDAITFTSSSTVVNFSKALDGQDKHLLLKNIVVACIGPVTAETARRYGLKVDVIAKEYTTAGLAQSLVEYFARGGING